MHATLVVLVLMASAVSPAPFFGFLGDLFGDYGEYSDEDETPAKPSVVIGNDSVYNNGVLVNVNGLPPNSQSNINAFSGTNGRPPFVGGIHIDAGIFPASNTMSAVGPSMPPGNGNGMPAAPNGMPAAPSVMPAAPSGMPAAPSVMPAAPSGMPAAPNGMPAAPNGMPAAANGMPPAPAP